MELGRLSITSSSFFIRKNTSVVAAVDKEHYVAFGGLEGELTGFYGLQADRLGVWSEGILAISRKPPELEVAGDIFRTPVFKSYLPKELWVHAKDTVQLRDAFINAQLGSHPFKYLAGRFKLISKSTKFYQILTRVP